MSTPHDPPFRAEHIGSLLRPRSLKDAVKARAAGTLDEAGFARAVDDAVIDAIRLQEEVGLPVVTDGEFRRGSWFLGFVDGVEGLTTRPSLFQFSGAHAAWECPYAEDKIRRTRGITTDEFAFVAKHTDRMPKVTLPSPSAMIFWRGDDSADRSAYPDMDAYYDDLAKIYREELAALAALGCRYVQLDEVPIAMLCDPAVQASVRERGDDPEAMLSQFVDLINAALADRPAGMTVGMHLCRGNYKGQWMAQGGYDPVARHLFQRATVDAFFLEYDSERAGGFEPLAEMPDDKMVVLGLVTTKVPDSPPADQLKRRVEEASRFMPLDRLAVSPQCGFASSVGGNPVTEADERSKLRLVVEVAQSVWG